MACRGCTPPPPWRVASKPEVISESLEEGTHEVQSGGFILGSPAPGFGGVFLRRPASPGLPQEWRPERPSGPLPSC